jgi:purine nucleosidase
MTIKVLLDTDIGSDIDDAVALAYLLAQPQCELLGITTVSGEAEKRAQIASALCHAAGRDIPIFPGRENALLIDEEQVVAEQAAVLDRWPHAEHFPHGEAIPFLARTIRSNPGEVILLTIGQLTNIAALFASDEEIPRLLKGIVSMCGIYNHSSGVGPREWNARLDPHATAIVYHSQAPFHRSVGLDITKQVKLSADEVRKRFQIKQLQPVLGFAEVWWKESDSITFHDPLAAATLFDDNICQFERGEVEIELTSDRLAGYTYWHASPAGRHEVARQVNVDLFFEHYFSVF